MQSKNARLENLREISILLEFKPFNYSQQSMDTRFPEQQYTLKEIQDAALIIHPKVIKRYNITSHIFEQGSNFTLLETPIIDEWGNEFRDSEGYYMSQRTENAEEKKMIAFLSTGRGLSTKARELFPLEQDEEKRISFMRKTIQQKFDRNPKLKARLIQTGDKEIIEYTYRGDTFFGIEQTTLKGRNVLGKLLMEYRDQHTKQDSSKKNQ